MRNKNDFTAVNDIHRVKFPSSALSKFKYYDEYEKCHLALLSLVIESLVSSMLRDELQASFGHLPESGDLSYRICFKMVLKLAKHLLYKILKI